MVEERIKSGSQPKDAHVIGDVFTGLGADPSMRRAMFLLVYW